MENTVLKQDLAEEKGKALAAPAAAAAGGEDGAELAALKEDNERVKKDLSLIHI